MLLNRPVLDRPDRPARTAPDASRSQGAVEDGLIRRRISLLAFDEVEVLVQAAQDLILNGFNASQFCVFGPMIGMTGIFDIAAVPSSGDPSSGHGLGRVLADLWAEPPCHLKLAGFNPVAMRCGRRAASLFEAIEPAVKPSTAPQLVTPEWVRPDLSRSIGTAVAHGGVILLVASSSAQQHALGARLLLRHGKHDLQTHEFSVRHPS